MTAPAQMEAQLAAVTTIAELLATELRKHGWGDFHYSSHAGQDPAVVAVLAQWDDLKACRQITVPEEMAYLRSQLAEALALVDDLARVLTTPTEKHQPYEPNQGVTGDVLRRRAAFVAKRQP